jgi:hypothetical protein
MKKQKSHKKNGIHLNVSYGVCVMGFVFFLFFLETRKLIIFEEHYTIFVQGILFCVFVYAAKNYKGTR